MHRFFLLCKYYLFNLHYFILCYHFILYYLEIQLSLKHSKLEYKFNKMIQKTTNQENDKQKIKNNQSGI